MMRAGGRARCVAVVVASVFLVGACAGGGPGGFAQASPTAPAPPSAPASPTASPSPSVALADALDAMIAGFQGFQGSALVARGDDILLSKGYGMADLESDTPNTPQTRFRLGSITKQFTAMAILILQSRGLLDVDEKACAFLDDCPAAWTDITIRQLLAHTSGLPNITSRPDFDPTKGATPAETLAAVRDLPLDFAPGERFSYSNTGYIALGLIVERASGTSYEDFLRGEIFEPLGMRDTGYDHGDAGLATGYKSATEVADAIDMSVPYAAGGLYSTVLDLHRWDQALYTDRLVPLDVLATLFEPQVSISVAPEVSYGYGFFVGEQSSRPWVSHGGGIQGFQAWYGRHPEDRLSVVFLANREDAPDFGQLDEMVYDLVIGR